MSAAKNLSKKFAALYYLLEDLLSPQKHYGERCWLPAGRTLSPASAAERAHQSTMPRWLMSECLLLSHPLHCRLGPACHQGEPLLAPEVLGNSAWCHAAHLAAHQPCCAHHACPQSVLVVAGGLLRSQEGQDEQDVLFRALRWVHRSGRHEGGIWRCFVRPGRHFILLVASIHAICGASPPHRDFNLPKILAQDLDVFCGLLADIFPGVDPLRQVGTQHPAHLLKRHTPPFRRLLAAASAAPCWA